MKMFIMALGLASCVSEYPLQVRVFAISEEQLVGALVSCVCASANNAAGVTNEVGLAEITLFHDEPEDCVLTIAQPGYRTQQRSLEDLTPLEVHMEAYP